MENQAGCSLYHYKGIHLYRQKRISSYIRAHEKFNTSGVKVLSVNCLCYSAQDPRLGAGLLLGPY